MESNKARIIKANHLLQNKVGLGPVDPQKVEKSQKLIDDNTVDFKPMAQIYLDELDAAITLAKSSRGQDEDVIQSLIEPVMQLKANGQMFDYGLVSKLAKIMLDFLEAIRKLDKDVIDIIEAHHTTIKAIVNNEMSGDGGEFGREVTNEIAEACKRYFTKRGQKSTATDSGDAYFVG